MTNPKSQKVRILEPALRALPFQDLKEFEKKSHGTCDKCICYQIILLWLFQEFTVNHLESGSNHNISS